MKGRQERYEEFYQKVSSEINRGKIADSLIKVCSVWLDRNGRENQVNVEFLLENSTTKQKVEAKKIIDKYCEEYGFTIDYVNLVGDLPSDWDE